MKRCRAAGFGRLDNYSWFHIKPELHVDVSGLCLVYVGPDEIQSKPWGGVITAGSQQER